MCFDTPRTEEHFLTQLSISRASVRMIQQFTDALESEKGSNLPRIQIAESQTFLTYARFSRVYMKLQNLTFIELTDP